MNTLARGRERLPPLLLWTGALAVLVSVPMTISQRAAAKELPWLIGTGLFLAMAALVWRRRPGQPIARWFALSGGLVGLVQTLDGLVFRTAPTGDPAVVAWLVLIYHVLMVLASIALAHLLGLFPDVRFERRYERRVIATLWWLLPIPALALVTSPTLIVPSYHQLAAVPNPYQVEALGFLGAPAAIAVNALQGIFIVGAVLLVPRYLRSDAERRSRIRWLLIPALFAAAVAVTDALAWRSFPDGAPTLAAEIVLNVLWIAAIASLPAAIAIALLRPTLLDVDVVIRRSLVYGLLWSLIAVTYVAAAAALGMVAGRGSRSGSRSG